MRINEIVIPSERFFESFKAEFADCVEELEERNGVIVAVVKRSLTFDPFKLAQMNSKLKSRGYDQFSLKMNTDGTLTIGDGTQLEHDLAEWVKREGGGSFRSGQRDKNRFLFESTLTRLIEPVSTDSS